jgi:hypothetical protein
MTVTVSAPNGATVVMAPLIATPTHDYKFCLNYHESILKLTTSDRRPDVKLRFIHLNGVSLIHQARNRLVKSFLKGSDCSHLFFIDSDIGFDPADFYRFLDADKDVLCGVYARRDGTGPYLPRPNTDERFAEVEEAATGFMCIRRNVFETLAEQMPALISQEGDETHYRFFDPYGFLGEDYAFCKRWRMAGGKVFVHTKARFTHQGIKLFTEEDARAGERPSASDVSNGGWVGAK